MAASRVQVRADETIKWIGLKIVDVYGARIGRASALVVDEDRPEREWLLIETGRFRKSLRLVPMEDAIVGGNEIWAPVDHDVVMKSPGVGPEPTELTAEFFAALERHYAAAGDPG